MGASPYPVTTALSTPESITALSFFLSCSARRSARLRSVSSSSFRRNSSSRLSNWTLRAARPDAPTAATVFQMPSDSRECPVSPPSGNAVAIFPFAGSATGFFPVRYGIPVPPIASGVYGKNRTKTAMIFQAGSMAHRFLSFGVQLFPASARRLHICHHRHGITA